MRHLFKILSVSSDAKTVKGEKFGYLTGILYLTPSDISGVMNVCPYASPGCRAACLWSAGMGKFTNVKKARLIKTLWLKNDKKSFLAQLKKEIAILFGVASAQGLKAAIRLNGTSDLPVHTWGLIEEFPNVHFYDYSKDVRRFLPKSKAQSFPNYHLTFSRSETNQEQAELLLKTGTNVAVVFAGKELPKTYLGYPVFSGDDSDLRFLDPKGSVIGLTAKGRAKKDESGFVVQLQDGKY